jgi:uncharacterized protein (TIRG00374 family)
MKWKLIPFVISIILIAGIIYFSDPQKIYLSIVSVNKFYIAIAFVIVIINVFLRVLKWKIILDKVKVYELFPVQILGMTISNFTPGKIAEPAKCILLRMRKGIPVSISLPTIIWERINDIISMVLISFVAIQAVSINSNIFYASIVSMIAFLSLVIILIATLLNRNVGNRLFSVIKRFPGARNISDEFIESFYSTKTRKRKILSSLAVTLVAWVFEGVIFYFVLLAMGIHSNFIVLAGIVSLSIIIGVASSLPGGIGSSEFVMIFLLRLTGIIDGTAAVFIYRILSFWFPAAIGGLSFLYLSRKIDMSDFRLK